MTELSGTLEGVGLPAIVRFLTGLQKTGCLRIVYDDWRGEIVFDLGQVTGAALGTHHGLTALDALVQALPGGSFTFDGAVRPPAAGEATITLSTEALQAHLDDLASQTSSATPRLPSLDAVPAVREHENLGPGNEPLPLDRATLQTLLAVDGRRTVQEIVAQRGSLDALWQLANLVEVGLLRMSPRVTAAPHGVRPAQVQIAPAEAPRSPLPPGPDQVLPAGSLSVEPSVLAPQARVEPIVLEPARVGPERVEPTRTVPFVTEMAAPVTSTHCPKLGFEDDPTSSFGRPTRMHRCFAAGTPLPLSLDQQRELCLGTQFATCPRLAIGGHVPPSRETQSTADTTVVRRPGPASRRPEAVADGSRPGPVARRPEPEADDPRIVRLPFVGRASAAERGAVADRQAVGGVEPTRFRSAGVSPHEGSATPPTPLRSRVERVNGHGSNGALVEPPVVPTSDPPALESNSNSDSNSVDEALVGKPVVERRLGGVPVAVIAGGSVILAVLAGIVYLLASQMGNPFADETLDPTLLPKTNAAAAGTPIAQLTVPRATSMARPTPVAASGFVAVAPDASEGATSKVDPNATGVTGAASAASASSAAPVPALAPDPARPAATANQPAAGPSDAAQLAARADAGGPGASTLLDERFTNNDRNWPSTPQGTAFVTNGAYHLAPRQAGQFVAVGAPIANALKDVVINATFHKLSGPPGGGYGVIVRDQAATPQDGITQDGHYYVLEVGDKGDVGMWRRDGDHWVDMLSWQPNAAVNRDTGSNDLSVRAVGNRLSMTVNGTEVVAQTDDTFAAGGVGLFAGGDGNQVSVDRFSIQTP